MISRLGLGLVVLLWSAAPATAQKPWIFFGGGVTMPTGDFGEYAKTGWLATAGVGVDVGTQGLWVAAEGHYGSNKHDDVAGDKTNILAGFGTLGYGFLPEGKVRPYLLGGVGFLSHMYKTTSGTFDETETKFAYTAAGGLSFVLSERASFWVEARYIGSEFTKMVPILAGIVLNFGN